MFRRLKVTYDIGDKKHSQLFNDTTPQTVIYLISLAHSVSTSIINILNIEELENE